MDVKHIFNYYSQRAKYSRYGHIVKPWLAVFGLLAFASLLFGIVCIAIGMPVGWLFIGFSPLPAMVVQWHLAELSKLPIEKNPAETIDARADVEILSLIPENATPKQLAYILMNVPGGHFFEVRFGVGGNLLKELMSDDSGQVAAIFEEAIKISNEVGGRVSAGVLILAMVRQLPNRDVLLGHLQLDENDLLKGIKWHHYIQQVIETNKTEAKLPGGIGRDWSFGWTPLLNRYGQNISRFGTMARDESHAEVFSQLLRMLENGNGTKALVGKDGVGKTEIIYKLASVLMQPNKEVPHQLWYNQVFLLDATRLLPASKERGELEQLVNELLNEAYLAKNIIVCLDNAELFFEDGVGSVDISSQLLPIIEAGRLQLILAMNEQKYLQISKRLPLLPGALSPIVIQPTDESQTLRILEDHIPLFEHKHKVVFMYQSLKEAYRLSQRYVYDVAMPGQAIQLLQQAADYPEGGLITARSVAKAIEQTTGVKTANVSDTDERETLLNLENRIHERMIGQERAVSAVSNALRRARSGVRNQNKPVGTFLFLGPTGVGKTELAKSLASVYFGGEQNIVRLDMNEFVQPSDVIRLIADAATDPSSLTAQVMKRPFSVVLLDEIEKAHSSVLSALLQLLDEGVLRDARNREISFKDTIVIATSNAGAERIQEYISRGYSLEQFEETFVNELIAGRQFSPEFLNRFDEMVVFSPLSKDQLFSVVDLIVSSINANLEDKKITVALTPEAKDFLVEAGYDPRLGARPMRRVVQKAVENTIASLLLRGEVTPGTNIDLTLEQVKTALGRI